MANNITKDEKEKKQAAIFTLTVLKGLLNERVMANQIDKDTADDIYLRLKHYVHEMGWI